MKQDVNLLQPMFRKQRAVFSARITVAICVLVALVLLLIYGLAAWRGASLESERVRLEAQRDAVTQRLNSVASRFQGHGKSQKLDAELAAVKLERDRKRQQLDALSRKELGSTGGFSGYFVGLARQRVGGLWLTRVELSASGQQITLQGVTLSEELIPRYLRQLGREDVFAGTEFGQAVLQRESEQGDRLRFELRTSGATQVSAQ
jgi:Tfp pilus assembly protein PilN